MKKYKTIVLELDDNTILDLIRTCIPFDNDLLVDISTRHEDIKDIVYELVLSHITSDLISCMIEKEG